MSPQRQFSFLVVCILAFYGEIHGQKNSPTEADFSSYISIPIQSAQLQSKFNIFRSNPLRDCWISYGNPCFRGSSHQLLPLPAGFYVSRLGIICKKELQMDKITPVRIRLRLGSLEYVIWMEQKPNARRF
jgi:hypothetical protein